MKVKLMILTAVLAMGLTYGAEAAIFTGTGDLGTYTAQLEFSYDPVDNSLASLDIVLENTSAPSNGGYITGFVLNYPEAWPGADVTFETDYAAFEFMNAPSANPYGNFDLGAALGGDFEGGGDPHDGIGVGDQGQFTFNFNSDNDLIFLDSDFLSQYSTGGSQSSFFVVRFKGFEDDGSDKVPGDEEDGGDDPAPVPEPGSLFIVGLGLIGLFFKRNS